MWLRELFWCVAPASDHRLPLTCFSQIISAAVVIGLSVNLHEIFSDAKARCDYSNNHGYHFDCDSGLIIPSLAYGIAAGSFALLDALVGLVAAFLPAISWLIMTVLDGLTAILLLAHGVVSQMNIFNGHDESQLTDRIDRTLPCCWTTVLASWCSEASLGLVVRQTPRLPSSV
jgi:hypothetical protein